MLLTITEPCLNPEFPPEQLKNYHARKISVSLRGHMTWRVMRRNVWNDIANRTTQQLYKVSSPRIDDHHFKEEELKSVGELSHVCSQIVLKCLYFARIGRPDILWSVNKLARSITKWTKAWPGGWGRQGLGSTGGGGPARVPNLRVCMAHAREGSETQR